MCYTVVTASPATILALIREDGKLKISDNKNFPDPERKNFASRLIKECQAS